MRTFVTKQPVNWGDCDAAGIIFYPNYYRWMDAACHEMLTTIGFQQRRLEHEFNLLGAPLVDARCRFKAPASYGDVLDIEISVSSISHSGLALEYHFKRDDTDIAYGHEIRVIARKTTDGIAKTAMPEPLKNALSPYLMAGNQP